MHRQTRCKRLLFLFFFFGNTYTRIYIKVKGCLRPGAPSRSYGIWRVLLDQHCVHCDPQVTFMKMLSSLLTTGCEHRHCMMWVKSLEAQNNVCSVEAVISRRIGSNQAKGSSNKKLWILWICFAFFICRCRFLCQIESDLKTIGPACVTTCHVILYIKISSSSVAYSHTRVFIG